MVLEMLSLLKNWVIMKFKRLLLDLVELHLLVHHPQQKLKPDDLLPTDESKAIKEFNIAKPVGEGILQGVNMLDSTYHVGINTVGQSLRNANQQLRSEPPNPQVNVSPWMNTTIGPDLHRRPLEIGESCPEGSL